MYTTAVEELASQMNQMAQQRIPFFFVVNFEGNQFDVIPLTHLESANVQYTFHGENKSAQKIELHSNLHSFYDYQKAFDKVKNEIAYGNSYLCNLTASTPISCDYSLRELYHHAVSKYKILYKDTWLCFSPEIFVQINEGIISSYPMKGTIDASLPHAAETLLHDKKEIAEHYTIVDLIRNDLSMIAAEIEVAAFRYLSEIKTAKGKLIQASSKITGKLPATYLDHLGSLFCQLLPAGSISGAPKKKTVEIIKAAENYERGFYTGVAGVFDGENLDSCVLIRFIEKTKDGLVYKSGGGITKYSELEKEYEELKQKIYVPTT